MKKTFILSLIISLFLFVLGSCEREVVSYCPFCGQTGIKEVSSYDKDTGITTLTYECQNSNCGKKFGAGMIQ